MVVSAIVPDAEMPMTEDGRHAEVCMNYGGVPNRLNWGCLFEHEINFIVDEVLNRTKDDDYEKKLATIEDIMGVFNYHERENFEKFVEGLSEEERNELIDDVYREGVPIHQPPFYDNINLEDLSAAYEYFGVKPIKFKDIERPLVFGEMYFIKLKHEPNGKLSARSCGNINIKGVPNKSNRNYRAGMAPYSTTPVRLGEQELLNLLLINDPEAVMDMLDFHSSNKTDRNALIYKLLTKASDDPVEVEKGKFSTVKEILKAYFGAIGLELVPSK